MPFDIEKHTIFEVLAGSHAHDLATPESDCDYRGVAIPPRRYFLGYLLRFEQHKGGDDEDRVIYDIRKFFELASDCNPNVIELLWVPESCIVSMTSWGQKIFENRKLFLSAKAKLTFSGYAFDQLKRIKARREWLLNPPKEKPAREKFGLPKSSAIPASVRNILQSAENAKVPMEDIFSPAVIDLWRKERAFWEAQREWEHYEKWLKEKNIKRAELEAKFGYDTKDAMHLVRLTRMRREIITSGEVIVQRPDREELMAIRNGAWPYDKLIEYAEGQDKELAELGESCTTLPEAPDIHKLGELCVQTVESFHGADKIRTKHLSPWRLGIRLTRSHAK